MNKVLYVLVFVFLGLAGYALFLEQQLNAKRAELTDRSRLQEEYIVKIAKTIEKAEPDKNATFEIKKDASPVENKLVDSPDMGNVLEEYPGQLEQANLETFNWGDAERKQLRQIYLMDENGQPIMDGNEPMQRGKGTEDELLAKLFEAAKAQQSRLNSTRAALTELRGKLEANVGEINKLKPDARQDKVTIDEYKAKVAKVEGEKTDLENQVTKIKGQIGELNSQITSLKDEVQTAKDETEAAREETAKAQKLVDQLKKLLQQSVQTSAQQSQGATIGVDTLPAGNKGKIVQVDNENMFAIVEFTEEAFKELKGENLKNPLPAMDLSVRRTNFKGPAGEFVGRLRLRQEVKGKTLVICDILGAWSQAPIALDDIVFAD